MEITRNIIQDLLPLYLAGEACPETRVLVEEFLARDPALAAVAASRTSGSLEKILTGGSIMPLPQNHEAEALARTRAKLQRTVWILALAIAFTLVPFSFTFDDGHITWMIVRDVPRIALAYWVLAAGFWIAYFVRRYRLRSVGL
jgi:anti-sigma factor RsiW